MVPSQWLAATQSKLKEALAVVSPVGSGTGSPPTKKSRPDDSLIASPRGRKAASSDGDGGGMSSMQTALFKSMKVFAEAVDEKFEAIETKQKSTDEDVEEVKKELTELKQARDAHLSEWKRELDPVKKEGEARHKETVAQPERSALPATAAVKDILQGHSKEMFPSREELTEIHQASQKVAAAAASVKEQMMGIPNEAVITATMGQLGWDLSGEDAVKLARATLTRCS